MSFILDALRKSESERQQDAAPSIARIPGAVPRHGVPAWAIATMAALGLGVVVLAGAWITTMTWPEPATSAAVLDGTSVADSGRAAQSGGAGDNAPGRDIDAERNGTRRVEPLSLPSPPRAGSFSGAVAAGTGPADDDLGAASPLAAAATGQAGRDRSAQSAPSGSRGDARTAAGRSPLAEAAQTSSPTATARPQTNARASSEPARSAANLPSVEAMPAPYHSLAPSLGLPELTLELLAFPEDPAKQFVFINGGRYAVGDTLPGGARVIAINARGAVLLAEGRQLQLETR